MGYTVSWYHDEQRHILVTAGDRFHFDDIMQMLDEVYQMRESSPYPGYLIIDLHHSRRPEPFSPANIRKIMNHPMTYHPRHLKTCVVNSSQLASFTMSAIAKIFPTIYTLVSFHHSMDEVKAKLSQET